VGWAGEAERDVWLGSRIVGGVEEQADELSVIICSRKKREKRDAEELRLGEMKDVEGGATDRKDVASAIDLDPRDWEKLKNGCHLDVLTMEFNPRRAKPDGK
jgi:hypothetical protein